MNVWRKEGILFARGLTLPQRLNYLATVLAYFDGWQRAFFYFALVYALMAGAMPIAVGGWVFLLHFTSCYALNFLAFEEISRGYGRACRSSNTIWRASPALPGQGWGCSGYASVSA